MKKGFQWMALLVVAMLGACSGGSDKAAAEKVDEKPRVKLAEVSRGTDSGIHRYGGSRSKKQYCSLFSGAYRPHLCGGGRPRVERPEAGQHGCCQSEADKISVGQPANRVQAY